MRSVNADDIHTIVLHNTTQHSAVARVLRLYSIAIIGPVLNRYPHLYVNMVSFLLQTDSNKLLFVEFLVFASRCVDSDRAIRGPS